MLNRPKNSLKTFKKHERANEFSKETIQVKKFVEHFKRIFNSIRSPTTQSINHKVKNYYTTIT